MTPIHISVHGDPAPKGSMRGFAFRTKEGKQRVTMTNMLKSTKPWQEQVAAATKAAMAATDTPMIDEAVKVEAHFYIRKPKSAKRSHPSVAPDLDKYQRAIGDALEGTLLTNDSRITVWEVSKSYGDEPGVHMTVSLDTRGTGK